MLPFSPRIRLWLICLVLFLGTLALYWPVRNYEFVNYDDPDYVSNNHHVQPGFNRAGIVWAFTTFEDEPTYWHPLTWLSHMLDCELFGTDAGGHHMMNAAFHAANSVLLFLVLFRYAGAFWPSAIVAAFFAWHPLQVESVAWVTERKNVLSTLLFFLLLLAYRRYVQQPGLARYFPVFLLLCLGLMAKPALVVVPCLLLVLDFWPLQRLRLPFLSKSNPAAAGKFSSPLRLVTEKLPLFLPVAFSCYATVIAHLSTSGLPSLDKLPISTRLANASAGYLMHAKKLLWPTDLAVFYPSQTWPVEIVTTSVIFFFVMWFLALRFASSKPYILAGWLWFLGGLFPTIGVVQAGGQSMADRFVYFPMIGWWIILVWAAFDISGLLARTSSQRSVIIKLAIGAAVCLVATAGATVQQLRHWKNSETLFRRTAAVTEKNYLAYFNLGNTLYDQNRLDEALPWFNKVLSVMPTEPDAHHFIGQILYRQGNTEKAIHHLLQAEHGYAQGLNKVPKDYYAQKNMPYVQTSLGLAFTKNGKQTVAMSYFRKAIEMQPEQVLAAKELAWILATHPDPTVRNGAEAVRLAKDACERTAWDQLPYLGTLDAAYAEAGQFDQAIAVAERLIDRAEKEGKPYLGDLAQRRLALYRQGKPHHE